MVDRVHDWLISRKKISYAPSLVLVCLAVCIMLSGCNIFLPTGSALGGANSYLSEGTAQMLLHLDVVSESAVLGYESEVLTSGADSYWNGRSRVQAIGLLFQQQCVTVTGEQGSCKAWRDQWVRSDNVSPAVMIAEWLSMVERGEGRLDRRPVIPADYAKAFSELTQEAYMIELGEVPLDWRGLCDVHPDLLFGGMALLEQFAAADVELFFDAEDLRLLCIRICTITDAGELFATIRLQETGKQPALDFDELSLVEGYLTEEWEMLT